MLIFQAYSHRDSILCHVLYTAYTFLTQSALMPGSVKVISSEVWDRLPHHTLVMCAGLTNVRFLAT